MPVRMNESLDPVHGVFEFSETDGQIFACIGCQVDFKEGEKFVAERTRHFPLHEESYVSRTYWHESCYDAAEEKEESRNSV